MCAEAAWLATVQSTHHHEVNAMLKLSQLRSETLLARYLCVDERLCVRYTNTQTHRDVNRCAECATKTRFVATEERTVNNDVVYGGRMTAMMHDGW